MNSEEYFQKLLEHIALTRDLGAAEDLVNFLRINGEKGQLIRISIVAKKECHLLRARVARSLPEINMEWHSYFWNRLLSLPYFKCDHKKFNYPLRFCKNCTLKHRLYFFYYHVTLEIPVEILPSLEDLYSEHCQVKPVFRNPESPNHWLLPPEDLEL